MVSRLVCSEHAGATLQPDRVSLLAAPRLVAAHAWTRKRIAVHSNYEYVLEKCRQLVPAHTRILDFGCGAGACVVAGRAQGLDLFGVDIFSRDDHREAVIASQLLGRFVFETVEGASLPFDDGHFGFVFCNMVFEHVSDIDHALKEIARVLKPDGQFLALFPGKECVLEAHVHIPFIHWFSKESQLRYPYMKLLRRLGLGGGGAGKSPSKWAEDQIRWLDEYTYYRTPRQINSSFRAAGFSLLHVEEDYIGFRLARLGLDRFSGIAVSSLVSRLSRLFCRVCGTQSILATKQ